MSSPRVTVTLGSNRPGGIDIALAGLAAQTFQDFEVIFVDGRYHKRHARVLEAVKASGLKQPFFHVPNHRYSGTVWGNPCAGYNTGFALAAGEITVMLLDYGYAPPGWLQAHVDHQTEPKIAMGPHEYRTLQGWAARAGVVSFHARQNVDGRNPEAVIADILEQHERFDEISIFGEPFTAARLDAFPREESDTKCDLPTAPLSWMYFNTKNESFPTGAVLDVNGMDENYDRGRGPGDPDLGLRLSRLGLSCWNVREAIVHCLNPRALLPNLNIVIPEDRRLPPPYASRWFIQDGYTYFDRVKADGSIVRAPNPFDIRELRERIWSWRDLAADPDPVLPDNIVPDAEYYR